MYNMAAMLGRPQWKRAWTHYCLAATSLVTLILFVLARFYRTFPGDQGALVQFQTLQSGWLDASAVAVSTLGWDLAVLGTVLGFGLFLVLLDRRADALMVVLSLIPMLIGEGLKEVIERPRPDYLLAGPVPTSFSFPSGHSLYAFLFGGILIYVVGKLAINPNIRRWLQAGLVLVILAVGASRVYLGVHWPSDVVGGYLFAGVALILLVMLRNWLINRGRTSFGRWSLRW